MCPPRVKATVRVFGCRSITQVASQTLHRQYNSHFRLRRVCCLDFLHIMTYSHAVSKPDRRTRRLLCWCHNALLPKLIRKLLANSHFTICDESLYWLGYWGRHMSSKRYRTVFPYQRVYFCLYHCNLLLAGKSLRRYISFGQEGSSMAASFTRRQAFSGLRRNAAHFCASGGC